MAAASRRPASPPPSPSDHGPVGIATRADFVAALDVLRGHNPDGTPRRRPTLQTIATATSMPVSTIHSYLSGRTLPPPEALDAIVWSLGVRGRDRGAWADALDRVQVAIRRPAVEPAHRTMAPPLRDFVGRAEILAEMDRQWERAAGRSPLLLLTGAAGIGKTSLALEWTHRHADEFPDGALQVDLAGFGSPEPMSAARAQRLLLTGLGEASGSLPSDPDELAVRYQAQLGGRRLVILLDNARDSQAALPLLANAAQVTTIVTSRDTLRNVAVRQGVAPIRVPLMDQSEASALLRRAAGGNPDPERVSSVVEACGGLPLALRLSAESLALPAAATVRTFGLHGVGDGMRGAVEDSVATLSPEAREAFIRLGAIPGRLLSSRTVSLVLGDEAQSPLDELVNLNLIEPAVDGWTRHDLVGEAAAAMVARYPAADELDDTLVTYYIDVMDSLLGAARHLLLPLRPGAGSRGSYPADEAAAIRDQEYGAMVALATRLFKAGRPRPAAALLDVLVTDAMQHGGFAEFASLARELANDEGSDARSRWIGFRALARAGQFDGLVAPEVEAASAGAEMVARVDPADEVLSVFADYILGSALSVSEDRDRAAEVLERCVADAERLGLYSVLAMARNALASEMLTRGENEASLAVLDASIEAAQRAGTPHVALIPMANAAIASTRLFDTSGSDEWLDRAQGYTDAMRPLLTDSDHNELLLWTLSLARIAMRRGDHDEAIERAWEMHSIANLSNDAWNHREAEFTLAAAYEAAGRYREALEHAQASLARTQAMDDPWFEVGARVQLGTAWLALDDIAEAEREYAEAARLFDELGSAEVGDADLESLRAAIDARLGRS